MTSRNIARVCAVVVSYEPDAQLMARLLAALNGQVEWSLVVDNAEGRGLEDVVSGNGVHIIAMRGNEGVAAAQNTGIQRALSLGATHVLLLDHDSVPKPLMVERLVTAETSLRAMGQSVAAVGASYRDIRHPNRSPFVAMGRWGFRRVPCEPQGALIRVSFLISAGSLLSKEAIAQVGLMNERLFIDYVDVEWCLRAEGRGLGCFGVPTAELEHRLGDDVLRWRANSEPIRVFGRTFPTRTPLRHYYLFRNGCWLVLHSGLPFRWKCLEVKRLALCFWAFAFLTNERLRQIQAMTCGTFDGIRGRLGRAA